MITLLLCATPLIAAAPYAHTQPATLITSASAALNGTAVPNGLPSLAWFEWGDRGSYGQTSSPVNVGSGPTIAQVSAAIVGLTNRAQYQCRLVISNSSGISCGKMVLFTTGAKVLAWGIVDGYNYGQTNIPAGLTDVVSLSTGREHSFAILTNGAIIGWGRNDYGQASIPAGLSNVVTVAGSSYTSAAIRSDGSVFAWGDSRTNVPSALTNAIAVAGGLARLLGLRADGKVFAWGYNSDGQTNVPSSLSNVVAIAGGDYFSAALNANGTVTTWGYLAGSAPSGLTNAVGIAAGAAHCLALKADGKVVAWGDNSDLQANVPPGLSNVVAISAGYSQSLALKADGSVVTWGSWNGTNAPKVASKLVAIVSGAYHNVELGNRAPQADAKKFSGPANHDLVVVLSGSDLNGDSLSLRLASLPATGSLYQFEGGVRGTLISAPGTTVSDPLGRLIFAPATDGYGDPFASFDYVANDGDLDSAPATITVQIIANPYAATQPPAGFTSNSLVLAGMAVPNGMPTTTWFEWGSSTNYGFTTLATNVGALACAVRITAPITGLTPGGIYHYRLVASNSTAVTHGNDQMAATGSKLTAWGLNDYGQASVPLGLKSVVAVDGGTSHSIALLSDSRIIAWGSNASGQTNVPAGLSNVVSISAGAHHNLALRRDGVVTAWGLNSNGQTNVPASLSNVVAVAGGGFHSAALQSDGTVVLWGAASYGSTNVPPGLSNVVAISAGWYYTTALKADGTVVSWGTPFYQETNVPPALTNVVGIASGWTHQMALRRGAAPLGWGVGPTNLPAGLCNVAAIACGDSHNVALNAAGSVVAWGNNSYAQTNVPAGLSPAAGVAAGLYHSFALANQPPQAMAGAATGSANNDLLIGLFASDVNGETLVLRIVSLPAAGTLYQYTTNGRGSPITSPQTVVSDPGARVIFAPFTNQFGSPYTSFDFVANDGDVDSAAATITIHIVGKPYTATLPAQPVTLSGAAFNGMVTANGSPTVAWFEWGTDFSYGSQTAPVNAGSGVGVSYFSVSVSNLIAGQRYHCRLVASNAAGVVRGVDQSFITGGRLTLWGNNAYGQTMAPQGLTNVVAVSGGQYHSLFLQANGVVLASGPSNMTNVPSGLSDVVAVSAGEEHSLALKSDGIVVAWGNNYNGETNVPAGLSNVVAIAAGPYRSHALKRDGTVVGWGVYNYSPPNVPPGLSNVTAIAGFGSQQLALRADGSVVTWPVGPDGHLEVLSEAETAMGVTVGANHRIALKNDGTVIGWGDNDYGKATGPAGLSNVTAVASGANHNLALKADGTVAAWGEPFDGQTTVPIGLSNVVRIAGGGKHSLALGLNAPPRANPQSVAGGFNQNTVITLSGVDINADPMVFRITALPTAGALYQFATNGYGAPISSPETQVTDSLGRVIFVPVTNAFALPYSSFSFAAHDGFASSPPASVTISIQGATFAFTLAADRLRANTATLHGVAVAGNLPSTLWFEWGNGQRTAPLSVAAGSNLVWFSETLSGLAANATYRFRCVASNAGGVAFGADRLFTTGKKPTAWGSPYDGETLIPNGLTNTVAIAGGDRHVLALQNDGSVVAWGENDYQQTTVPPGLNAVVGIAAGGSHSLALKSDGTVVAWGASSYGQTNVPAGLAGVTEISAGLAHSLALRTNGTVVAWGWNQYGQTNVPPSASNVVAIAAGRYSNLALRSNGTVLAWGNYYSNDAMTNVPPCLSRAVTLLSELGAAVTVDGSLSNWSTVTVPADWTNILDVQGFIALKPNGGASARPSSAYFGQDIIPTGMTNVAAIAAGTYYSMALGNLPPVPLPQSVKSSANHPALVRLAATDQQEDPVNFRITSLPAKGALYQYTASGSGPQITLPNTPVTDGLGRVVFVPLPDEYGSPYTSFGFLANDGELDSTQAVVSVTIIGSPYAATQPAAPVSPTNAVLNGMIVPNGFATRAWFEWGTNVAFGQTTVSTDVGNGAGVVRVSTPVDELVPGRIFYFRLAASNAVGVAYGAPRIFTTGSRLAAWGQNDYGKTNVPANLKGVSAISADSDTTYALLTSGTVSAWGWNQTNLPVGLSDVVAISGTLALKRDGSVQDWGYGTPPVPDGLSNIIAICGESLHRLALRSDGTVLAWGYNNYGQTNVPVGLKDVVAIVAANYHSLALKADGSVIAWGYSNNGETNVPAGLSNVVAIACGSSRSLAATSDGRVVAWGENQSGQNYIPASVSNVIALAAGYYQNLAIQVDGTLLAWGYNAYGVASKPSSITNAAAVAANWYHDVVLQPNRPPSANSQNRFGTANQDQIISLSGADPDGDALTFRITRLPAAGNLYQYSGGGRGALITSNNTIVTGSMLIFAPATNAYGAPYVSFNFVATDGEADSAPASVAISISGTAYAATLAPGPVTTSSATLKGMALSSGLQSLAWFEWGTNASYGFVTTPALFNGGGSIVPLSVTLTGLTTRTEYHYRMVASNATRAAFGGDQSFLTGGKVTTWGQGIYGLTNVPAGLSNVVATAGGSTHSLALRADGTVKAWGGGDYYSGTNFLNVPVNLTNAMAIAAGNSYSAALRSNGTVVVWGSSSLITNVPASASNVIALASGSSHLLAQRTDGRLVAWGNNSYGQLNLPSGLSNVVAIAGGSSHSLALKIDGTVVAWGYNSSGQCNVPGGLTNVVAIAAGYSHSLALSANGTIVGWGSQAVPAGLNNVVKIAAGDYHSLALVADGSLRVWGSNNYGQTNVPANLGRVVEIEGGANHSLVVGDNLPPATQSRLVSGFVNADLILSLTGFDPNGDPLAFRVITAPVPGTLYQFNAGSRGAQIAAPAAITDVSNRVIFVPVTGESGSPYSSFGVIVNDGEADSAPATVTVNVIVPPAPQLSAAKSGAVKLSTPSLNAAAAGGVGGGFGLRFLGYSNLTYQVWASTNLVNWVLLGPANVTSNGWLQFVDADATNWSRRFYRISMPTDRAYGLNFSGQSNASYRVWASTNLANWELLGAANVTSNGWFQFLDFDSARWPQRFYRAGAP